MAFAKFCFCKNNKRTIDRYDIEQMSIKMSAYQKATYLEDFGVSDPFELMYPGRGLACMQHNH
jgi:hypothetical protein